MYSVINTCSILGLEGYLVHVEVDISPGLPAFEIVGLPDMSIRESKERVKAAIKNSGFDFPTKRVTVNLAPADIRKEGPIFDLPIAVGILVATGQVNREKIKESCLLGELSLSGDIKRVSGVLVMASRVREEGIQNLIVPDENKQEAALVTDVNVYGLGNLADVVEFMNGAKNFKPVKKKKQHVNNASKIPVDFSDIVGQLNAKRALEIAAAGGHNVLMIGAPGSGKTLLARAMVGILPDLTLHESLELTKIYSVCGILPKDNPLITQRPFRAPHHNISVSSLIGGGTIPKPGEITLANYGVLFLDELTEYTKKVLESLRQPLEDGEVLISRLSVAVKYPARFSLIGAINPCPCGYLGDNTRECICTNYQIKKYLSKLSGPLLDRFDMQVHVPRINKDDFKKNPTNQKSNKIKLKVEKAREIQRRRFLNEKIKCNSEMNIKQIKKVCRLTEEASKFYEVIYDKYSFTMRSYIKILKLARTIADLENEELISLNHLAEAIQYRDYDRFVKEFQL